MTEPESRQASSLRGRAASLRDQWDRLWRARSEAIVICCQLALGTGLVLFFEPGLLTNDDALMASVSMGSYTGQPNVHTVFVGVPISGLVALLSMVGSGIPWYALVLYFGLAVSVVSGTLISARRLSGPPLFTAIATLFVATATTALSPSYNVTSILLGSTGVVCLMAAPGAVSIMRTATLAGCALGVAFWFREYGMYAVIALLTPAIVLGLLRLPNRARLAFLGSTVFLVLIGLGATKVVYHSNDWQEYLSFNRLRGELHENPRSELIDGAARDAAGWTVADQDLFFGWLIFDDPVFSALPLERLLDATPAPAADSGGERLGEIFGDNWIFVPLAMASVAAAGLWMGRRAVLLGGGFIAWFIVVASFVPSRFPHRIAMPLWLGLLFVLAALPFLGRRCGSGLDETPHRDGASGRAGPTARLTVLAPGIVAVGAALVSVVSSIGPVKVSERNHLERTSTATMLRALTEYDPDATFIVDGTTIGFRSVSPWDVEPMGSNDRIISFGWHARSPLLAERVHAAGISGDLPVAIVSNDDTYLVTTPELATAFARWMPERRDLDVAVSAVHQVNILSFEEGADGLVVKKVEPMRVISFEILSD